MSGRNKLFAAGDKLRDLIVPDVLASAVSVVGAGMGAGLGISGNGSRRKSKEATIDEAKMDALRKELDGLVAASCAICEVRISPCRLHCRLIVFWLNAMYISTGIGRHDRQALHNAQRARRLLGYLRPREGDEFSLAVTAMAIVARSQSLAECAIGAILCRGRCMNFRQAFRHRNASWCMFL